MPRRRLSEHQLQRIRKCQERCRQRLAEHAWHLVSDADETPARGGLVVVRHGARLAVEDADNRIYQCLVRQNIGHPVCGDRVIWQPTGRPRGGRPGCGVRTPGPAYSPEPPGLQWSG